MSQHIEQSDLFEEFCEERDYQRRIICPYCGDDNQLDPPLSCCGEIHAEIVWDNGREYLDNKDILRAFNVWIEERRSAILDDIKANRWDNLTSKERGDS